MLPVLMYNTMESNRNQLNNNPNSSFGLTIDESVILNSVRSRKKVSELPNCPVCSCTIRQGELDTHLALEVDRLTKLSGSGGKRKLSSSSSTSLAVPGSSSMEVQEDTEVDVSGATGSDVYQRVHINRLRRLRARSRRATSPPQNGECPVCNATLPVSKLQRHALRCLKRTGAEVDEDVPDTSSEDGSIDVENDEPRAGGSFGAEYQWCGQWRVRATALQEPEQRTVSLPSRNELDHALVVDGDEDAELYGPPQYSPSRIALDADISGAESSQPEDNPETLNGTSAPEDCSLHDKMEPVEATKKPNGLVEASAETRIQALKARIKDLEAAQNSGREAKCLICLGPFSSPAVSIQCWHVYCEVCWLESLRAKKICPQCNAITTTQHLRRIYM